MNKLVIASDTMVKASVQKINEVCHMLRKRQALQAILYLQFCKRSVAKAIIKIIKSAVANSVNNYNYNVDTMYLSKIYVGKSVLLKRSLIRARGKSNKIVKHYSRVTVVLEKKGA